MSKLTVALLFGGKSVEHQISINSAQNIFEYIDKDLFELILIGISPTGDWYLKKSVDGNFDEQDQLLLSLSTTSKGFVNKSNNELIKPDIVFPVLHGTDGEDGSIQGLLQSLEIPFVGSGVLGSAMSMSKLYSKKLLQAAGIPTSSFISFDYQDKDQFSFEELEKNLGLPFMVKASNLGSSVGVIKVNSKGNYQEALTEAFKFDHTVLVESYVKGRELECSVMGNSNPKVSLPAEIIISSDYEFYTYDAKYRDPNAVQLKIPAEIDNNTSEKIRNLSLRAYKALGCEDFARVDLFLKEDGEILVNEINTIPGFTNSSMFPMMWKERGIEFKTLISQLIDIALENNKLKQRISNQYKP